MEFIEKINWSFWIAFLAVVLSQLPPIRDMIKGTKLRIATADMAQFSHFFGNSKMYLWVTLENVGGKSISINRIICFIRKKQNGKVHTLAAKTYWLTQSLSTEKPTEVPLAEIILKPGERFSAFLHFWDTHSWEKAIEGDIKSITLQVGDNIAKKINEREKSVKDVPINELPLVEADPQLIQGALKIVESQRKLEVGEYDLLVVAYSNQCQKPQNILGFELTLFESDIKNIFEDIDDYKFGFGICFPSKKRSTAFSQIWAKKQSESEEIFKSIDNK